jgi:hypothetical protein
MPGDLVTESAAPDVTIMETEVEVVSDPASSLVSGASHHHLSTLQQQAVDQAFQALFGYPWGTRLDWKDSERPTESEQILCRMLGKRAAATVLYHHGKRKNTRIVTRTDVNYRTSPSNKLTAAAAKHATLAKLPGQPSALQSSTKTLNTSDASVPQATETTRPAPTLSTTAVAGPRAGGVDNLLKALQGAESSTTIAKTSADWDMFKDKTGLADKLEEKAEGKDSFLNRQDFLTRVDHRTFELERKDRDSERAKRGK